MEGAFADYDVSCFAIMPALPPVVARLKDALKLSMTVLSDPEWSSHRALGLKSGSFRDVLFSRATWRIYRDALTSGRIAWPKQNIFRLGGAAIIDADGNCTMLYRSQSTTDYAPPSLLVSEVERTLGKQLRTV